MSSTVESSRSGAWWMLFVLWLFYVYSLFDRIVITMLVDPIKHDLSLSDVQMSVILGPTFAIFYGVFGWPLGWVADRYPRRWVIYGGISLWSLAAAGSGLARSLWGLLLCRAGVGVGEASLLPAAYSLLGDSFPKGRLTTAMSVFQTAAMIGQASAFGIGGLIIAYAASAREWHVPVVGQLSPWAFTLFMTGGLGLLLALLVFTFSEPHRAEGIPIQGSSERAPAIIRFAKLEWRLLLPMFLAFSLVSMLGYSLVAWVPTYMARQFGWGSEKYGPFLGAISALGAIAMIAKGWIVDRLYSRGLKDAHIRFYTWLVAVGTPIGIGAFFMPSAVEFIIAYGVVQILAMQFIVYLAATIYLVTPRELRAQTVAISMAVYTVVGGLGPLIAAALTQYVLRDERMVGMSLALMMAVCLPSTWLLLRLALRSVEGALLRGSASNLASMARSS